jgi:hypothetical protein
MMHITFVAMCFFMALFLKRSLGDGAYDLYSSL